MLTTYILIGSERCPPRADRSSPALVAIQSGAPRIKNREGASGARRWHSAKRERPGRIHRKIETRKGGFLFVRRVVARSPPVDVLLRMEPTWFDVIVSSCRADRAFFWLPPPAAAALLRWSACAFAGWSMARTNTDVPGVRSLWSLEEEGPRSGSWTTARFRSTTMLVVCMPTGCRTYDGYSCSTCVMLYFLCLQHVDHIWMPSKKFTICLHACAVVSSGDTSIVGTTWKCI